MGVIERLECPEHGPDGLVGRRCAAWERPYVFCARSPVVVEYVPRSELTGAVEALRKYGGCLEDCNALSGAPECSCGFDEAMLRALGRVGGQSSPAGCPACSRVPGVARPPHTCSGEQS